MQQGSSLPRCLLLKEAFTRQAIELRKPAILRGAGELPVLRTFARKASMLAAVDQETCKVQEMQKFC